MKATAALLACIGVCAAIIAATLFTPAGPPPAQPVVTALLPSVARVVVPPVGLARRADVSVPVLAARGAIAAPIFGGDANYADPVYGARYLAIRFPRGTLTRICGAGRCMILRSTDYGPKRGTGDIADIGLASFARICGYTIDQARRRGECRVSIELLEELPKPPATDTD